MEQWGGTVRVVEVCGGNSRELRSSSGARERDRQRGIQWGGGGEGAE